MQIETWDKLQIELADKVVIPATLPTWANDTIILGLDVQYDGEKAFVAGDVLAKPFAMNPPKSGRT